MKVLYISISFPKENEGDNLYTDLAEEISKNNEITVVVAEESKNIKESQLLRERGFDVLRVKTGNMFNVNVFEKAISYITIQGRLKSAINRFLNDKEYDLIIFTAPPVTLGSVIKYAMKKYNAKSYLMQKDIFPQNALDIGMMKKTNPAYWYFKFKEKKIYKIASKIGCMSQRNIEYLYENNKYLPKEKLELFPNTIKVKNIEKNSENNIRAKYNIPNDSIIAIYGGNFGKPQGIDFITKVVDEYKNNKKITFIFSGKGTEKNKLYNHIKENKITNAITLDYIPKQEYNDILKETDIGLVFLDYRFKIPNIPSRTLSYLEYSIPIMAATDKNTDYREIIENNKFGLWSESNNISEFKEKFDMLINDSEMRESFGKSGRTYLEREWTVEHSVKILENTYNKLKKEGVKNEYI